jgi:hypothetical protein
MKTLIAASSLAVALAAPASAATALVADPTGDVPYSFSDQVDVTAVNVTWTDHLVVRVTYAAPPPTERMRLLVSSAARAELDPAVRECDADATDSFTVNADEHAATFQDPSIAGELSAPAAWEGNTVTYTFSSPTLTRKYNADRSDPFVCLDGIAGEDDFYGAFDGKAAKLTTAVAENGMRAEIDERFGVGHGARTKVRCLSRGARKPYPGDEFTEATPAMRWCAFEARVARARTVFGGGAVYLTAGRTRVTHYYGQRYPTGTRDCGTTDFSGKWLLAPFPENFGGASMSVTARRVSCRVARRIARRYGRSTGAFRCSVLKSAHEYRRTKCSASRGRVVWIETGA